MARAFAVESCSNLIETDGKALRPADLLGILTNLAEGDALLIRDLARASKAVIDSLAVALRDLAFDFVVDKGMFAKTVRVPLKRFTCIATALSKAECPPELIEIFPLILPLQGYSQTELVNICHQLAQRKGIMITPAAAALVAGASVGTPHDIEVQVDRLSGLGRPTVAVEDVERLLSVLGVGVTSAAVGCPGDIDTLSGVDFENVVAALLQRMGFHTEMTAVTGDGGIDIVATLDRPLIGGRYLIQCKRLAPGNLVGAATVRDFYGALTADRQALKGLLITTTAFTSQVLEFARQLPIELISGRQLRQLLAKHGTRAESQGLLF